MANYFEMSKDQLRAEKAALEQSYAEFKAKGLKLNMARGKPGPHQMDLAMDLLKMSDYTTENGYDARNYGNLEGLEEARTLFADVMGVKSSEVFVGGNSSLQLMYNLISIGHTFGFPESPCPWSQVEHRKFLCPAPGYDRHFKITEEFGFELITIPMTPDGPDMDMVEKLVAEDDTIKGIWCVPQYSNPDGYVYSDETIRRFASMKTAAPDFKIFWDEAYIVHHLTDEIIEFVSRSRRFMPHFHIPLQSGCDEVLQLMRRRYDTALFASKVKKIKEVMPDAFIGVDVIVGTRGETPEYFEQAYQFIDGLDVTQLHVFSYSERPGTQALKIEYVVSPEEKHQRSQRLLALSDQKTQAFYARHIGQTMPVLMEKSKAGAPMHGFTENYIRVEVESDDSLDNQVVNVRLGEFNEEMTALKGTILI